MHARVVLGVGKGVLFREVSSVQLRGSTVHTSVSTIKKKMVSAFSYFFTAHWKGYRSSAEKDMGLLWR